MTADIIAKVFPYKTHQIISLIANIVLGLILSPAHTHVTVNGIKPLSDCAASFNVGFFDHNNLFVSTPVTRFICRAAATKPPTDDEYIRVHIMSFLTSHKLSP